ncbi:MAG: hypothetical protein H0X35_08540 [Pseudonocardiales bacterium]|nr:hypothetical protein [Pseudonocardiales bacterium]
MIGKPSEPRPGWVRDVELPSSLDELRGPTSGVVRLPLRLYWSGPDPQSVEWDIKLPQRRTRLYEVVLREGNLDDVREFVDGRELVRIWDQLYLPRWLREAWSPLIDAARAAA